jgi:hypothetical protein
MAVRVILPVGVFNPNKPGVPETAGPIRISEAIVTSSVALMCFIGRITLAKTISSSMWLWAFPVHGQETGARSAKCQKRT